MPETPETPVLAKPNAMMRVPVGLASPLWGYFAGAAVSGTAWWLMTRWVRPQNLEAMFGKAAPVEAPVEAAIETAVEVLPEPVVEAVAEVEAVVLPEPVVEAAPETVVEPVVEPAVEIVAEAAPEPVLEATPAMARPKPRVRKATPKAADVTD